jgi:predicted nuclease of predicted toxin-antitoxin system
MSLSFMKLLLDENLPKKLRTDFPGHDVLTVRDMEWNGIKNGPLLQLMIENGFHALLTFDKNLQHQQNFKKYTTTVFVLSAINNTYAVLTKLTPKVLSYLSGETLPAGSIIITA